jgi:hypothetical protein
LGCCLAIRRVLGQADRQIAGDFGHGSARGVDLDDALGADLGTINVPSDASAMPSGIFSAVAMTCFSPLVSTFETGPANASVTQEGIAGRIRRLE